MALERVLEGWRRVWLLPFIHEMLGGPVSVRTLAERLGTSTRVAKTAIYALRRLGLVERVSEGVYRLREGVGEEYRGLFEMVVRRGGVYLAYTGSHYIYVRVSRRRASGWVLPGYLVERVAAAYMEAPGARPSEIGRRLGMGGRSVSRALRVARLAGLLPSGAPERVEDEG